MTPNQELMVYWITEREAIRKAKESGLKAPWSKDPIFQSVYFCNVNREDDKVTRWIRNNWTYPNGDDGISKFPTKDVYTFAMIVARIFNLPATLEVIGQPEDRSLSRWLENAYVTLKKRQAAGETIWNGAYIVSTNGKKINKLDYCLHLFRKASKHLNIVDDCETLAEAHKKLMGIEGLASFLAAQIVADLKNTPNHPLQNAYDWETFSSHGPGSLRGLSWFFEKPITAKTYQEHIHKAYDILFLDLHQDIVDVLCMQNLQNCFCEYDKYMRVLNQTGRSKRRYKGV